MMTPADAIMGRLGKGPAGIAELATAVLNHSETSIDAMYPTTFATVRELVNAGRVEHLAEVCCYRLSNKLMPDGQKDEDQ